MHLTLHQDLVRITLISVGIHRESSAWKFGGLSKTEVLKTTDQEPLGFSSIFPIVWVLSPRDDDWIRMAECERSDSVQESILMRFPLLRLQ